MHIRTYEYIYIYIWLRWMCNCKTHRCRYLTTLLPLKCGRKVLFISSHTHTHTHGHRRCVLVCMYVLRGASLSIFSLCLFCKTLWYCCVGVEHDTLAKWHCGKVQPHTKLTKFWPTIKLRMHLNFGFRHSISMWTSIALNLFESNFVFCFLFFFYFFRKLLLPFQTDLHCCKQAPSQDGNVLYFFKVMLNKIITLN